jgi:hypothetical protein
MDAVQRVFFGFDVSGSTRDFGTMFWIMHSSLIPTVIYLLLTLIAYLLRVLLELTILITGRGAIVKSPFGFTASLVTVSAVSIKIAVEIAKRL